MSSTAASAPWAAPLRQATSTPTLGRLLAGGGMQWSFKPNCSITPAQLGLVYLSLCALSMLIAAFFYWQGAPFVAAFAGIELLALGLALLVFARHVGDHEILTLQGSLLAVRRQLGTRQQDFELPLAWLSVEPAAGQGSLVQLRGRGQQLHVGRFLRPHQRAALALELRLAQRRALAAVASPDHKN
jgi:uncharacterized membrane protein